MGIADAMRGAFALMPDRVSVSFRNQTTPGVYTATTVNNCWRRGRMLKEAQASGGIYVAQVSDWFIPKSMYPTQPAPGDVIRFTAPTNPPSPHYGLGGDYIIIGEGVSEKGAMGAWRCTTAIPFLQSGLMDTASIYRPSFAAGDGGRNVETGRVAVAVGVSCKIQPTTPNQAEESFGVMQIVESATCFLSAAVDVEGRDIFVDDATGEEWTVKSEQSTRLLGVLMAIGLERYD